MNNRFDDIIEKKLSDWKAEGIKLFGENMRYWKYVCPCCGFIQSGDDFMKNGASKEDAESMAGFSCIGRIMPGCRDAFTKGPGPCNYAGGGLFKLNPIKITNGKGESECFFDFYRGEK